MEIVILKNCPLCGRKASYHGQEAQHDANDPYGWVGCMKCHCYIWYANYPTAKKSAIETWNKRVK